MSPGTPIALTLIIVGIPFVALCIQMIRILREFSRMEGEQGRPGRYPYVYLKAPNGLILVRHDGHGNFWWHPGTRVKFIVDWEIVITMDPEYHMDFYISMIDERLFRSASRRFPESELNF